MKIVKFYVVREIRFRGCRIGEPFLVVLDCNENIEEELTKRLPWAAKKKVVSEELSIKNFYQYDRIDENKLVSLCI